MRYKDPNTEMIRILMGKPFKKLEGVKRAKANTKGMSKGMNKPMIKPMIKPMSFMKKIAKLAKGKTTQKKTLTMTQKMLKKPIGARMRPKKK